jgi:hypothetical protein
MTPERMTWDGDEKLYQPRIHSRRIRALHQISRELGEPMTVLIDQALGQYIDQYRRASLREWGDAFADQERVRSGR